MLGGGDWGGERDAAYTIVDRQCDDAIRARFDGILLHSSACLPY